MSNWATVVLAAGLGTRMKSTLPKVLHPVAGRALVEYPVRAAFELGSENVVVVVSASHREAIAECLGRGLPSARIQLVVQDPPRGTGDAARVALSEVAAQRVLILCGDTPLVQIASLRALMGALDEERANLALLTAILAEPSGYGRVLRDAHGQVVAVREHRDCSEAERQVQEVNAGMYVARTDLLREVLAELTPANAQGEYYLTDSIALTMKRGLGVLGVVGDPLDLLGVNDRSQLVHAEELLFERIARRWCREGVTVRGGARIDDAVTLGPETVIEAGVRLRGATRVGSGVRLDVGAVITDSQIGDRARVGAHSVLTGVEVGAGAEVAPLTRLP